MACSLPEPRALCSSLPEPCDTDLYQTYITLQFPISRELTQKSYTSHWSSHLLMCLPPLYSVWRRRGNYLQIGYLYFVRQPKLYWSLSINYYLLKQFIWLSHSTSTLSICALLKYCKSNCPLNHLGDFSSVKDRIKAIKSISKVMSFQKS